MKRSILIAVFVFFAAVIWIVSGQFSQKEDHSLQSKDIITSLSDKNPRLPLSSEALSIQWEDMVAQPYKKKIIITGQSQPYRTTKLRSEIEGIIRSIPVEEGEALNNGDIVALLAIDDRKAKLQEAEQLLKKAETEYQAARELQKKGYASTIKLTSTQAEKEVAKARLKQAELTLAKTKIRAPYQAILEKKYVELGTFVSVGDEIADLVDLSPIKIVGFLSESQRKQVSLDNKATVRFGDGQSYGADITYISSHANPESRTFRVELQIENKDHDLVSGLTASIDIEGASYQAYFVSSAVLNLADDGTVGVKVIDSEQVVRFMPVKILSDQENGMWITVFAPSIRLITVGHDYVENGQVLVQ